MTLVVVVSVFVVCELPDTALRLLAAVSILITGHYNIERSTTANVNAFVMRANCFTNVLLAVNSSVNFIIYFLVGNKFREILARQCGCQPKPRPQLSGRGDGRFLHPPESGSAAGFTTGLTSVSSADRRDGFVWSSRRPGGGRILSPRSPTTEHGGWQRPTIAGGFLAVPGSSSVLPGTTSVVQLEICTCNDTTVALRDAENEKTTNEQLTDDVTVGTSEIHQHQPD